MTTQQVTVDEDARPEQTEPATMLLHKPAGMTAQGASGVAVAFTADGKFVRIIGGKKGTGGSSGTEFLRAALDLRFFPELWEVRVAL